MEGQEQPPRLLDQVRNVLRLHYYSIHTERSNLDWIKKVKRGQTGGWNWSCVHRVVSLAGFSRACI